MPRPTSVITITEEYHNKKWLDLLLQVDTKHPDYPKDGDLNDYFISSEEQSKLKGLMKGSKKNADGVFEKKVDFRKVKYGPDEYGRYMSKGTSLQSMWKFVRKVVSGGAIQGFDIENSQPSILLQLCNMYAPDEKFNYLEGYVNNRAAVKKEVAQYYGCTEDIAKTLIIILCFGGSPKTWKDKFGIQVEDDMPLIKGFHKNLSTIRQGCANCFKDFAVAKRVYKYKDDHGLLKEYSDLQRSALAMYLQDIEGSIIMLMYKELPKLACVPKTPIHDEMCFKISDNIDTDEVICKLQAKVKEELGFDIKLKLESYTLTDAEMKQLEDHKKFVLTEDGIDDCVGGYNEVKALFEKEVFKIKYNAEFGIEKDGVFNSVLKKKDLDVAFTEWTYNIPTDEGSFNEEKFLKRWYDDKNKRMYDCIDFIPPPLECPDTIYNLWRGFDIERSNVEAKDPKEILDLIWVLANKHQESYDYMLNWLAQMIQSPAKKPGTALVFKSKQGAGKGTLIALMRKIMGNLVAETANPQQEIFGSHGNAHIGKILVSLDEIKNGDTIKVLNRLKNLITSDKCIYNEKGVKQVEVSNSTRFIFSTNESIPITLDGKDDRRYCLIECANDHCKQAKFWNAYYENVVGDDGKIKGFFNYLMERDVEGVNWMQFPETQLREDLIQVSTHPMVFWWDKFIHEQVIPQKYTATKLFESYKRYCTENGISVNGNSKGFGIIFKDKIDFDACGIIKTKSHGVMVFNIDRSKSFEWLKENEYSVYETLKVFGDEDSDEEDGL